MTPTAPPPDHVGVRPTALVLLAGVRTEIAAWVSRSVVPLATVPLEGWTVVLGTGSTPVGAPYDDAGMLLAARPVPPRAGPALGFFELDGRAVVTVHGAGRRKGPTWVVWEPDLGLLRPPGLELAGPAEITRAAGAPAEVRDELVDLLHEKRARPVTMLQAVMATLGLPGARLLAEPARVEELPGTTLHQPAGRQVGWFEDAVADSVRLRRELGALG
ncbi:MULTISPECIES: hypothetical protein [unclassified Ornithinimicrobium]|uniref:hypothetical protein n=1 Tax=unclassified Ornithinimicrobium TaxID=2615080 RepID=UPI0038537C75